MRNKNQKIQQMESIIEELNKDKDQMQADFSQKLKLIKESQNAKLEKYKEKHGK